MKDAENRCPPRHPALSLTETFEAMHALLRRDLTLDQAADRLGTPPERLAVYPRFVAGHVRAVLEKNFPALASVLGDELWQDLVRRFYRAHPPAHYELNRSAAPFVELLADRLKQGEPGLHPAHLELAELEWQEFSVYMAPQRMPRPAELDAPAVNPTLAVLQLTYPVASFLRSFGEAEEGEAPPFPLEPSAEVALVFRHPESGFSELLPADDALLFAFKTAHDGLSSAQAAAQADLPEATVTALLRAAAEAGLVILPAAAGGDTGALPVETARTGNL